jgi:hypothetical protein
MKDRFEHLLHEDELARWRREGEQYARAKPDEDRVQRFAKDMSDQRLALRSELSEMRAELQRVCSEHDADRDSILELTKTVGKVLDDLPNWMEAVARKSQNELRGLIAERSGETVAQLRALDARMSKAEDGLT